MSEDATVGTSGSLTPGDWPQVARIYAAGLATGMASFETVVPEPEAWDRAHLVAPRLGQWGGGQLLGFAVLAPVSTRPAYRGVAEVSVYVRPDARGQGVGRNLLQRLVVASEEAGLWTLQASIFPENAASLALHRSSGFRMVGTRKRIGRRDGRWRDVVLLERRSPVIGAGR